MTSRPKNLLLSVLEYYWRGHDQLFSSRVLFGRFPLTMIASVPSSTGSLLNVNDNIFYWWRIFAIARKSLKTDNKAYRIVRAHDVSVNKHTHTRLTTRLTRLAIRVFGFEKLWFHKREQADLRKKKMKRIAKSRLGANDWKRTRIGRYCYETVGYNDWTGTRTSTTIGSRHTHTHWLYYKHDYPTTLAVARRYGTTMKKKKNR